jgi:hypothetical protein
MGSFLAHGEVEEVYSVEVLLPAEVIKAIAKGMKAKSVTIARALNCMAVNGAFFFT